jgi:uncharacterized protein YjbI with pentapeptide repeats
MKEYKNQEFKDYRFSPEVEIRDRKFVKCNFNSCRLSVPFNIIPEERTKVINCSFENCEFSGSNFQSKGFLQKVLFHNISQNDYMSIGGVIFDRVTFKGKFDKWILDSNHRGMVVNFNSITESEYTVLDNYAQEQYEKIDWALDISEADFKECELRSSIPAHLVKRNPETQMLIKYEKVIRSNWEKNSTLKGNRGEVFCRWVANTYKMDTVIVAPVRNKKLFAEYMEGIQRLRAEGIGELD